MPLIAGNKNWIAAAALLLGCRSEAAPATAVYAVTKAGSLYRTTDGAASWQQVPLVGVPAGSTYTSWLAVDPVGNISLTLAQDAVGKGRPGDPALLRALYRSVDGGQTWSHTDLPATLSTSAPPSAALLRRCCMRVRRVCSRGSISSMFMIPPEVASGGPQSVAVVLTAAGRRRTRFMEPCNDVAQTLVSAGSRLVSTLVVVRRRAPR